MITVSFDDLDFVSGGDAPACTSNGQATLCSCSPGQTMTVSSGAGGVVISCEDNSSKQQ
jgi:hypothetical protein